ncbi:Crp/Fnr family transcriptional regulator [Devosia algicola]|uniref:Crp/Fnr family transcriptional regulator n=1 Tax=Devosia algicola TaxID=3026418 RepID=A0ABY7YNU2_9HYPH|nr:Crp/Fnr family transcriptional regulator [Devosia algicola]WDR02709.1 Crp/Fnr family transcriptional regulator [Devosia algicola]
MSLHQADFRNRLLRYLSDDDLAVITPLLEHVELPKGLGISEPNQAIGYYYFMESGIGSIVAVSAEGQRAEVGLVGRDGIIPTAAVMECDTSPHVILIQIEGQGYRIEAGALVQFLTTRPDARRLFVRFVQTLAIQTACTALSNSVHHIEERLARWILMCHDRTENGEVALTHEYISIMLAVRRPSVTTALHVLEGNHLVYSERGMLTIRDRAALENFALDAYGIPEQEYARLVGPMR